LERAAVHKHLARLRYGGRKSGKLVRCYLKKSKDAYRVEVEKHSSLLKQHGIRDVRDLVNAARVICPKHFRFAEFDWKKLGSYLAKKMGENAQSILVGAQRRAKSMRRVTRYLRRKGIQNVHRFLVPLAINDKIESALKKWALQFEKDYQKANGNHLDNKRR
jgi:hypothetical protein